MSTAKAIGVVATIYLVGGLWALFCLWVATCAPAVTVQSYSCQNVIRDSNTGDVSLHKCIKTNGGPSQDTKAQGEVPLNIPVKVEDDDGPTGAVFRIPARAWAALKN